MVDVSKIIVIAQTLKGVFEQWVCCEKLILDQCSLMGEIIGGGTDG